MSRLLYSFVSTKTNLKVRINYKVIQSNHAKTAEGDSFNYFY